MMRLFFLNALMPKSHKLSQELSYAAIRLIVLKVN